MCPRTLPLVRRHIYETLSLPQAARTGVVRTTTSCVRAISARAR
jgi:hypothetical protein